MSPTQYILTSSSSQLTLFPANPPPPLPLKKPVSPKARLASSFLHDAETLEGDQKGMARRFQM